MTSKLTITDERIEKIAVWLATESHSLNLEMLTCLRELQERRKAELDSEPVAYTDERNLGYLDRGKETAYLWGKQNAEASDIVLYRHAQQAPERNRVRCEHAEWSHATFGNVGPVGPLKHLSKEALEAAAEPDDLSEWADMQFLLWDAQRRAGITDEQITQAMIEKLAVNKQREWPEPKDGEPRLHIKEQPAPVVPDNRAITQHFDTIALETAREIMCDVNRRHEFLGGEVQLLSRIQCRIDEACRAAMLTAGSDEIGSWSNGKNTPTVSSITPAAPDKKLTDYVLDEIIAGAKTSMEQYLALSLKAEREAWRKEGPTDDERIMAIEGIHNCERCGDEGWFVGEMGITRCACNQAGNSPVIPDGLIAAVNRLLDSDGSRGCYSAIRCGDAHDEIERLLAAAPQEVKP